MLGRSLDELSPQTRNLLLKLHEFVADPVKQQDLPRNAIRFNRRELRQSIAWSDFQVRSHLKQLVDLEYLLVHRGRVRTTVRLRTVVRRRRPRRSTVLDGTDRSCETERASSLAPMAKSPEHPPLNPRS